MLARHPYMARMISSYRLPITCNSAGANSRRNKIRTPSQQPIRVEFRHKTGGVRRGQCSGIRSCGSNAGKALCIACHVNATCIIHCQSLCIIQVRTPIVSSPGHCRVYHYTTAVCACAVAQHIAIQPEGALNFFTIFLVSNGGLLCNSTHWCGCRKAAVLVYFQVLGAAIL